MGYSGIPPLGIGPFTSSTTRRTKLVVLMVILLHRRVDLRPAAQFPLRPRAARDRGSEQAARALGIHVSRYKLAAFVIAALYASVAGSLFAHFVGFISPEVFGPHMVVLTLHHALCRRHRHDAGAGDRRRHRFAAAGNRAQHRPFPGHRLLRWS